MNFSSINTPKIKQLKRRISYKLTIRRFSMSKRMTESQIVAILKEADAGVPVKELCRQHGIASSTFYNESR